MKTVGFYVAVLSSVKEISERTSVDILDAECCTAMTSVKTKEAATRARNARRRTVGGRAG